MSGSVVLFSALLAAAGVQAHAADGAVADWLEQARGALEELQSYVAGPAAPLESPVTDSLLQALAASHKHLTRARRQRDLESDTTAREIHQALLYLAYGKGVYGNLTELDEELPAGAHLGLLGFDSTQRCLSEASFACHRLNTTMKSTPRAGGGLTVEVVLANEGRRQLRGPKVTLSGPEGWLCQPQGKWVFTELPPGRTRAVVFTVTPPAEGTAPQGIPVTARISYFVYFGRAVVEREHEVRPR